MIYQPENITKVTQVKGNEIGIRLVLFI
jgi:hypothetical protein